MIPQTGSRTSPEVIARHHGTPWQPGTSWVLMNDQSNSTKWLFPNWSLRDVDDGKGREKTADGLQDGHHPKASESVLLQLHHSPLIFYVSTLAIWSSSFQASLVFPILAPGAHCSALSLIHPFIPSSSPGCNPSQGRLSAGMHGWLKGDASPTHHHENLCFYIVYLYIAYHFALYIFFQIWHIYTW